MTALELAAALLTPDSDLLPVVHEREAAVFHDGSYLTSCACGWWSLPFRHLSEAVEDYALHKRIHSHVLTEWGWTRA